MPAPLPCLNCRPHRSRGCPISPHLCGMLFSFRRARLRQSFRATVATMDTPSVMQRLKEIGADLVAPERRSSQYLQKFVESEIVKWAAPIKAAGIQVE